MDSFAVAGSIAARTQRGGHVWAFLQYLLGLRQLGLKVAFLDCVPAEARDGSAPLRALMQEVGLGGSFTVLGRDGVVDGVPIERALAGDPRLLNVMGFVDPGRLGAARRLPIFLDIDPGFGQMWRELGLADVFSGHGAFVTVGENIGKPFCEIPTCGLDWITTRPPVVLDQWPVAPPRRRVFTTVASWRGAYDPIEYQGKRYGLRVHEFRKFLELPRITGREFELALDIDPGETRDLEELERNGWRLVDPREVAGDPWRYREYIQGSYAEFSVAKGMYVETRSGWFSDRTVCYLASGKPALVQDTGISELYPTGEGLLVFSNVEEAAAAIEEICSNYERHSRAARAIAEEYFDSDKVLSRLLGTLGGISVDAVESWP